jgi:hypothetical protein
MADELKTERVQMFMTPSEVQAIDDWSFANRVRGRSEAIRRLVAMGLATQVVHAPAAQAVTAAAKPRKRSGGDA